MRRSNEKDRYNIKRNRSSSWEKVFRRCFSKGGEDVIKRDDGIFFFFFLFLVTLGTTVRQKQLRTQLRKVHRAAL